MPRARRNYTAVAEYFLEHDLLGRCLVCARTRDLHYAHLWGRVHDDRRTGDVHPLDVVILGGPFGCDCHTRYDNHELNIVPHITKAHIERGIEVVGLAEATRLLGGGDLTELPR